MKYPLNSPYMPYLIDEYRTGSLPEDNAAHCCSCGRELAGGDMYYDVKDSIFCLGCADAAKRLILEEEEEKYIYEY